MLTLINGLRCVGAPEVKILAVQSMNPERGGSVRAGLLIIMMMFFAGLALDIATLAVALTAFVLLDRAIYPFFRGQGAERGAL
jgi:hypothetical protein